MFELIIDEAVEKGLIAVGDERGSIVFQLTKQGKLYAIEHKIIET